MTRTSLRASRSTVERRLQDVTLPGWRRWAPQAALVWALGYGAVRVYWTMGSAPAPPPMNSDLIVFTGWWSVALCGAAALVVLALRRAPWSRPLAVLAWAVAAALVEAGAPALLDVAGTLEPGMGVVVQPGAVVSRVAGVAGGALVGATVLAYQRHWRGACPVCGRTVGPVRAAGTTRPPRWAWFAAWAAVGGWFVRLVALLAVGFDAVREAAGAVLLFEGVLLPVGTVLPLALVHPWGRVVPRWVPLLAGRPVPRWLLLGPGLALAVVTTAYFGPAMVEVAVHTFTGTWEAGPGSEPLSFFWVAVPAHLV